MDDTFLTVEEIVAYLRVHERTVYRLLKSGELPAVRVGRQWRVRRAALDAWLEKKGASRGTETQPPAEVAATTTTPTPERGPRRVLVADDDPYVREVLRRTLASPKYLVDAVPDGQAALDRLRVERYDLLIVDLKMPGVDGMEVVRAAKQLAPGSPVIIITGHPTEASAIDAVNLGVRGYLTKPFRLRQVLATVAQALGE